jgi:hypothetical protein
MSGKEGRKKKKSSDSPDEQDSPPFIDPEGTLLVDDAKVAEAESLAYTLIEDKEAVMNLCKHIFTMPIAPVLGVDCEGLLRNQSISLL